MRQRALALIILILTMAACGDTGGFAVSENGPFAPGTDPSKEAVDGLEVGHRLMDAGEYELALDAFIRAASQHGLTADVQAALGTANLALGRLGQAEKSLRDAAKLDPERPEIWNNLGVVVMEAGRIPEAELIFKKAYALDNGESDSIRDNLRLALAKSKNPAYDVAQPQEYKLVRRGSSDFLIRQTP